MKLLNDEVSENYKLGKLTFGFRPLEIQDLRRYSRQKLCGKIVITFLWIFSGKGFFLNEIELCNFVANNKNYEKIVEEYPELKTLLRVHHFAIPKFKQRQEEKKAEPSLKKTITPIQESPAIPAKNQEASQNEAIEVSAKIAEVQQTNILIVSEKLEVKETKERDIVEAKLKDNSLQNQESEEAAIPAKIHEEPQNWATEGSPEQRNPRGMTKPQVLSGIAAKEVKIEEKKQPETQEEKLPEIVRVNTIEEKNETLKFHAKTEKEREVKIEQKKIALINKEQQVVQEDEKEKILDIIEVKANEEIPRKEIKEPEKEEVDDLYAGELETHPLNLDERYPGQPSQFKHLNGDWSEVPHNFNPMQILSFVATNPEGSIYQMGFYKSKNSILKLWINIKSRDQAVIDFYIHKGFKNNLLKKNQENTLLAINDDYEKAKEVFQIIKENNQFPEPYLEKIAQIINEEDQVKEQRKLQEAVEQNGYPAERTIFKHTVGDWTYDESPFSDQRRFLHFVGSPRSLLVFSLTEYKDGRISMAVAVNLSNQRLVDYFENKGFERNRAIFRNKDNQQLKDMFQIIKENNQIPEPYLSQISQIVNEVDQVKEQKKDGEVENKLYAGEIPRPNRIKFIMGGLQKHFGNDVPAEPRSNEINPLEQQPQEAVEEKNYPAERTILRHAVGDWTYVEKPLFDRRRFLYFLGSKQSIVALSLVEYADGRIVMSVGVNLSNQRLVNNFENKGFLRNQAQFRSNSNQQLKEMFEIIKESCEIPEPYLTQISQIVNEIDQVNEQKFVNPADADDELYKD